MYIETNSQISRHFGQRPKVRGPQPKRRIRSVGSIIWGSSSPPQEITWPSPPWSNCRRGKKLDLINYQWGKSIDFHGISWDLLGYIMVYPLVI